MDMPVVDRAKLDSFVMRALEDLSGGYIGVMVSLGAKLGLYKAMAGAGPLSSRELAARSGCAERYVREWLNSQAAAGYVQYHAASGTYELLPEQALVLADEHSPTYIPNAWGTPASMWFDEAKALEAFRSGGGIAWSEHDGRLFCGVAAFYRNAYQASLVSEWLPALDGVVARLEAGTTVADVGCGHGHSTILMAKAFPRSRFFGFDAHAGSIAHARRHALEAGVEQRVTFEVASATSYPQARYGLVCFFDTLHDLGDPLGAARHAREALAPQGTLMVVEPFAHDRDEQNHSLVGKMYYSASATICCAHAISEGGHLVLGAQAGEARLAEVFRKAGFGHCRRAAQSPFNIVLELRR